MLIRSVKIVTKPRATSYHLPKLSLAVYLFEKNKIDNFRHVNTCVQHVHADRYVWLAVF